MWLAKTTGHGSRRGAVTGRSQTRMLGSTWIKRDTGTGRFLGPQGRPRPIQGRPPGEAGQAAAGERATSGCFSHLVSPRSCSRTPLALPQSAGAGALAATLLLNRQS